MNLPKEIKLGLHPKSFKTKEMQKHLKKARGFVMFIFEEKGTWIIPFGIVNSEELGNAFGTCMKTTFGINIKILHIIEPLKRTEDYAA